MTTGFVRSRLRAGVGIGCAAVLALSGAVLTTPAAAALPQSIEQADPDGELAIVPDTLVSITPARFVDTRSGAATVDGQFAGGGKRAADTEFEITVAGRDTVPADAAAVVVNVTAVDPDDRGYVTLHPCVGPRPLASSLNFVGDVNTGNEVVAALSSDGSICAYTSSSTHLTIDVVGYVPATGEISPIVPARLLDTRPAATTVDGVGSGAGRTTPGSSLTVPVAGRGGVPASGVHSVLVNVTAVNAQDRGFVVAHGCLPTVPSTSSLNHVAGVNRGNELLVELSADGEICLFTNRSIHLTVDVVSYILSGSTVATIAPSRLADSRPGGVTVDGADAGFGTRSGGSEYTLQVTGRAGVPTDAQAAVVNLTAVAPTARGFITVHPCVSPRPVASSLNYIAGVNGANELIAGLSADGELCIFTNMTTDFAVDIVGYLADSAAPMADLSITKSDNVDPVIAGNPLTYTVTVSNAGPADAENVRVTDELPDDMTFVSTTGCDNDPAGAPECQLGDIAAGTSKQFTITSAIPIDTASATVTNSATVGSDTADPVGGNNTAQEDTTIQGVGTISIVKASDPTGGTGFGFTDDIAAPNAFTLDDGQTQTFIDLTPGTYTVVEDDPTPSFDLGALTCDDGASATPSTTDLGARTATINLDPGESITCTFGNVERGSVTIVEDTDPDGPTDFAFTDDIALPNSFSLDDDTDPTLANTQTFTMVGPGTYDVTQIADPDFAVAVTCDDSASATPSTTGGTSATVNVDPGEDVTCTFTNTRKTGTIEVVKDFVGTAGLVNLGIDMIPQVTNVGDGGTTGAVTVDTGDHFASEAAGTGTDLDDYTTTHTCTEDTNTASPIDGAGTSTDSIPVEEGDAWTCTFTNTERGTIIVEKQTLPDGDPQTFTFTGDAAGIISDNGTITVNDLTPGTYTSTETAVAGWNLTDISCDDANSTGNTTTATATFNLEPGETVTCTYTNTERGTIIVEKQTLPDGDPQTFTFTGDAAGIISDNGTITVNDLTPGTYTSTETAVAGWNLTDISCDDANSTGNTTTATATFNLEPGETVTCTYTNSFNSAPTITSGDTQSAAENQTAVTTVTATDPDLPAQTLTFSITGGADQALFGITAGGVLTFNTAPDFETPTDTGGNGTYDVQVTVTDNGTPNLTDVQDIAVTVTDVEPETPPNGTDDSYTATGNVSLTVPLASGVLINDTGTTLTVSEVQGVPANVGVASGTSATGLGGVAGSVTLEADGSFTYQPPPGFVGFDTFTYEVANGAGSDTATVTITVSDMIWFVDNASAGANRGTLADPFTSITALNSAQGASSPNATDGQTIFVSTGTYTDGAMLRSGQQLIGEAATLPIATIAGITLAPFSDTLPATSGSAPVLTDTVAGANGIDLSSDNLVRGLDIGNTGGVGLNSTANAGTLTVSEVAISGTGGGVDILGGGSDAIVVILDDLSSSSVTEYGIRLQSVGGIFSVLGATGTVTTAAVPAVEVISSSTTVDYNGTVVANTTTANGINLTGNAGATITLGGRLDIDTTTGTGFNATGGGTIVANGANSDIDTTTGVGVNIVGTTIGGAGPTLSGTDLTGSFGVTLRSVSVAGGTANGIVLDDAGSGGFTVTGTGTDGSGGTLANTSSDAILLANGTANVELTNIVVSSTGRHGLIATGGVSNLVVNSSQFTDIGDANGEEAFSFDNPAGNNLGGQLTLNDVDITRFFDNGINVFATSGTLAIDVINGSDFVDNADTAGMGQAIIVETEGTAGVDLNVAGSVFDDVETDAVRFEAGGSGTNNADVMNNTVTDPGGPDNFPNGGSFSMIVTDAATLNFDIQGNTQNDLPGDGILVSASSGGGNISGRIGGPNLSDGNMINGSTTTAASDGINVTDLGVDATIFETVVLLIQNNTIDAGGGDDGIQFGVGDSNGDYDVTIRDNTISNTGSEGIRFFLDDDSFQGPTLDLDVTDNSFTSIGDGAIELATRESAVACANVTGNSGGGGGSPGIILFDERDGSSISVPQASVPAVAAANNAATVTVLTDPITFNASCSTTLPSHA